MDFTRDNYRGLELDWFAVDRRGSLGLFCSGYGDIPKLVFESEERHRRLAEFFEALPETAEVRFVDGYTGERELFLQEARRGLYSYWHHSYSALDPYELIAYPVLPVTFDALPAEIRTLLDPFRFPELEFGAAERIAVQDHFECD